MTAQQPGMDAGRFRFGLSMLGSYVHAGHSVEPEQHEPGIADAYQPAHHELDIGLLEWDLDAQLGLHRRFAFELLVPIRTTIIDATFIDAAGVELPGFASIHHRDETIAGLGDLSLGGRIGLVLPEDVPRWTLALRLGASFPTGHIEPDPFELGEHGQAHQHMFFGSGTVDPSVGFDSNLAFDKWGLVAWGLARVPFYENRYGYLQSKVAVGGIGAQSGFGLERWSFLIQPELYFETPALWNGTPARNSGRTSLLATAGVFVRPAKGWQLHMLVKVPYATWAQGGQLQWPLVATLGFSYTFDLGESK
jgi:hypothetical protein